MLLLLVLTMHFTIYQARVLAEKNEAYGAAEDGQSGLMLCD